MKRKLLGCLGILFCLLLGAGFLGYSIWHKPIPIPDFLSIRLKGIVASRLGLELSFSDSEIIGQPGKVKIASFSLSLPGKKPFFYGKKALLDMGKTESL